MVLGQGVKPIVNYGSMDKGSKYGYQKKESYFGENEKKGSKDQMKSQNEKNYGAWGPVYKNRQNFNDMHIC